MSTRVVHRCLAHILSAQLIDLRIKPGRYHQKRKQQCILFPSPEISVTIASGLRNLEGRLPVRAHVINPSHILF
jgi:hypothetical protein